MSRELKPCPFCNGPAVNVAGEYVTCGSPTFLSCAGRSVRADVEDWNRRATPSQRLDAATVERCKAAADAIAAMFNHSGDWLYEKGARAVADAIAALVTVPHQHGGKAE